MDPPERAPSPSLPIGEMFAYATRCALPDPEAEDIAQEAVIITEGRLRHDPDVAEANWKAFIRKVVMNLVRNARRRRYRRRTLPLSAAADVPETDDTAAPGGPLGRAEEVEELMSAINKLPHGAAEVILLALEGFSPAEIADHLGISTNSAFIRLHRARRTLRGMFPR